jgi:hypothetical protein
MNSEICKYLRFIGLLYNVYFIGDLHFTIKLFLTPFDLHLDNKTKIIETNSLNTVDSYLQMNIINCE